MILGLGMGCAAWADGALDPTTLGSIDAIVASCAQVNPAGKAGYDSFRQTVIGEHSEADVAAATQSPEYRQAYDVAHQKTEAEEREVFMKECGTLASSMGPRVHQRPQPRVVSKPAAKSAADSKPAPKPATGVAAQTTK
jgi:hypothetical protein